MFWTSIFTVSIAQALFLISLILLKGTKNLYASVLMIAMLLVMTLTNFGYLVSRTPLIYTIPFFFIVPFGMIFLFGPLLFLYSKSILDSNFEWKHKYWLHFVPYLFQLYLNLPLYTASIEFWDTFNTEFLNGRLQIRTFEKIAYAIQDLHLLIYLAAIYLWIIESKKKFGNAQFIISISARIAWIKQLTFCLAIFLVTVSCLYISVLLNGFYMPVTNYVYTIVISSVIYFIAYKMILKPELIILDFTKKYKSYKVFDNDEGDDYVKKIKFQLEEQKLFTNPELKLADFSALIGLPSHQLSKLINEKFGKSFIDLVNELRVNEFINRINDPQFQNLSILGIALDVGFNTKSSFNNTFKKMTGKTPSEFRK
jgi:AraC-like DNA-binding protein